MKEFLMKAIDNLPLVRSFTRVSPLVLSQGFLAAENLVAAFGLAVELDVVVED